MIERSRLPPPPGWGEGTGKEGSPYFRGYLTESRNTRRGSFGEHQAAGVYKSARAGPLSSPPCISIIPCECSGAVLCPGPKDIPVLRL